MNERYGNKTNYNKQVDNSIGQQGMRLCVTAFILILPIIGELRADARRKPRGNRHGEGRSTLVGGY